MIERKNRGMESQEMESADMEMAKGGFGNGKRRTWKWQKADIYVKGRTHRSAPTAILNSLIFNSLIFNSLITSSLSP